MDMNRPETAYLRITLSTLSLAIALLCCGCIPTKPKALPRANRGEPKLSPAPDVPKPTLASTTTPAPTTTPATPATPAAIAKKSSSAAANAALSTEMDLSDKPFSPSPAKINAKNLPAPPATTPTTPAKTPASPATPAPPATPTAQPEIAPPSANSPAVAGEFRVHIVLSGQTLWKISGIYYGKSSQAGVDRILQANPAITNANLIYAGQKLVIPQ